MKNSLVTALVVALFLEGIALNALVMERGGAFFNYAYQFGFSSRFTLSGPLTVFASCAAAIGFCLALIAYRAKAAVIGFSRHLAIVAILINMISLITIGAMAIAPSIYFHW